MTSVDIQVFPEISQDAVCDFTTSTGNALARLPVKYVLSVCAATNSELVTYPLDIVKTRLQIQSENVARGQLQGLPKSIFTLTWDIVRTEGRANLWRGLAPTIYRHILYTGSWMIIYETLRDQYANPERHQLDGQKLLTRTVGLGIFAGALGQLLASPVDLVKVHMQMDGHRIARGLPPRVTSTSAALREIIHTGGLHALGKGGAPNIARASGRKRPLWKTVHLETPIPPFRSLRVVLDLFRPCWLVPQMLSELES